MTSSSENPYVYGHSAQNLQAYPSPQHIPQPVYYPSYYGNFAMVRPPQISQKRMAYHGSPYKKRLVRNGGMAVKRLSKEQQQIYSTFKPPNPTNEEKSEGTQIVVLINL